MTSKNQTQSRIMETKNAKQRKLWKVALLLGLTIVATLAVQSYRNAGFVATLVGPHKITGTITSVDINNVSVGVDIDGDGVADIMAVTNAVLLGDIMKQSSEWSEGETDGYVTEINPYTPIKAYVVKTVAASGTILEKTIPEYILFRYGANDEDLVATK